MSTKTPVLTSAIAGFWHKVVCVGVSSAKLAPEISETVVEKESTPEAVAVFTTSPVSISV